MFCRPRGQSPYDAVWGPGLRDFSPIVARTSVHARQLMSARPSYLKAFLVHSRGGLNANFCTNCEEARASNKDFTAFAGCVSIPGVWGGACSNCIWQDHGARCTAQGGGGAPIRTETKDTKRRVSGTGKKGRSSVGSSSAPLLLE